MHCKVLVLFLFFNSCVSLRMNEIKMTMDLVNSFSKPTAIFAFICDKDYQIIRTAKMLGKNTLCNVNSGEINQIDNHDVLIIVELRCSEAEALLRTANDTNKFRKASRWFIIGHVEQLKNYNIMIDSDVIVAEMMEYEYSLHSVYKTQSHGELIKESFGTWTMSNGFNKTNVMNYPASIRRKNLLGLPIPASIVISDNRTKNEITTLRNILVDTVAKSGFRQISPLYDFMNATMVTMYTDTWGYNTNGTINGMIGDFIQGKAEIAGTVIFIKKSRLDILEYLIYPSPPSLKFVFRQPLLSYENNLFILPFKPIVWLCILGLIVLLTAILMINAFWEYEKFDNNDLDQTVLRPNISDVSIMVISAISQQGSSTELKGNLGRVVMFLLFFAFLFLYTSYSANIVALLQSNSNKIRTLTDLLNSRLELGVEDTPYNRYHFSVASDPIRKAIYQTKIAPQGSKDANFMSLEEGVKKLQTKPFAFNMNLGTGYKLVERYFHEYQKCGLQEIQFIQESKAWLTCRKNSPFKEIFKIGLMRNQEHGTNDRVNRLVYTKRPTCAYRGSSFDSVNMIDFYPALLLLLYGIMLAFLSLLLEIVYHRQVMRCFMKSK